MFIYLLIYKSTIYWETNVSNSTLANIKTNLFDTIIRVIK